MNVIILAAGQGERLRPLTKNIPKCMVDFFGKSILERQIDIFQKLGIDDISVVTGYCEQKINVKNITKLKNKNFSVKIKIIEDGKEILDTGGGILNLTKKSREKNFLVFNPDTLWKENYINEINQLQNFYYSNQLSNILLVTNKNLSYDKNLKGDFQLKDNLLSKNLNKDFIYIGCQILNKSLFEKY